MYLYFNLYEKYECCEPFKETVKKEDGVVKYPLYYHFLELLSIDSEDFYTALLSEFANRIDDLNRAVKKRQEEFFKSIDTRGPNYSEIVYKEESIIREIQQELNEAYDVNFDYQFYWLIFKHLTGNEYPYKVNMIDVLIQDFCVCLTHFKSAINYYIEHDSPISINSFYILCEIVRMAIHDDDIKIPAQHIYTKGDDRLDIGSIADLYNDDISTDWHALNNLKIDYRNSYHCERPLDLLVASLFEIVSNKYYLKKCDHCGKYFVPFGRSDEKYCNRQSPYYSQLICKEAAKYFKQLERERGSESKKIYKSIYTMKLNKLNNAFPKDMVEFKNELDSFMAEASEWREEVKSGYKTEEEYVSWLNSFKKRGKRDGFHKEKG